MDQELLITEIKKSLQLSNLKIDWLAGDGSDRSYYRIKTDDKRTFVLMQLQGNDAERLLEGQYDWIELGQLLRQHKVPAPRLIASLPAFGALIIEDYGDETLEIAAKNRLKDGDAEGLLTLYHDAIKLIEAFLKIPKNVGEIWTTRAFDVERYNWELNFFIKKFVQPLAPHLIDEKELVILNNESQALAEYLAGFSNYFVHRDYHSRNLMHIGSNLASIDFQDARLGSPAYDLVSLCFDSYVPLNQELRHDLLEYAIETFRFSLNNKICDEIKSSWPQVLLQRQLKAIGSFAFLTLEKKRGNYLQYVTPALNCLDSEIIFDKRWPFLSGEFLNRLKSQPLSHGAN
ncbi:MAG: phosphotransferase [Oligoflexales bacterium]|nr:phosphotransferase [Oligoflexales bacterium]